MIIDITRLKSNIENKIIINEKVIFSKEQLEGTDLIEIKDLHVDGEIIKDNMDEYIINCNVEGIMILPCAITLKPVEYPFSSEISGNVKELLEEMNENDKKIENTIDILPIIWENILMEIPIKVLSEEAKDIKLEGNGWKLITEEKEEVNPELQKLRDLLK